MRDLTTEVGVFFLYALPKPSGFGSFLEGCEPEDAEVMEDISYGIEGFGSHFSGFGQVQGNCRKPGKEKPRSRFESWVAPLIFGSN